MWGGENDSNKTSFRRILQGLKGARSSVECSYRFERWQAPRTAAETPAKFQSKYETLTTYQASSRLCEILG